MRDKEGRFCPVSVRRVQVLLALDAVAEVIAAEADLGRHDRDRLHVAAQAGDGRGRGAAACYGWNKV